MTEFEKAVDFVVNSKLDYAALTETKEYKIVNANMDILQSFTDAMAFVKFETILIGDLYRSVFSGINKIDLTILYKVKNKECYYAKVRVEDENLKRRIRESAKSMKGVKLKVRCIAGGIDYFELVNVIGINKSCNFGRCICPNCGYDYGFEETERCCICGSKVRKVFDFYNIKS